MKQRKLLEELAAWNNLSDLKPLKSHTLQKNTHKSNNPLQPIQAKSLKLQRSLLTAMFQLGAEVELTLAPIQPPRGEHSKVKLLNPPPQGTKPTSMGHKRWPFLLLLSRLWNFLPQEAKLSPSLPSFCKQAKTFLFRPAFPESLAA